jgi:hypothetical protein
MVIFYFHPDLKHVLIGVLLVEALGRFTRHERLTLRTMRGLQSALGT